jgi:hypothetical protein
MRRASIFILVSCGAGLAGACGGSAATDQTDTHEDGGDGGDGGGESKLDSSVTVDASKLDASMSFDATTMSKTDASFINFSCFNALTCPRQEVCCANISLSGIDVTCEAQCAEFALQLCASAAECPIGRICMTSGLGVGSYCTKPTDAGVRIPIDSGPADSGPADSGPADSGPADSGPADGGPKDGGPADSGKPDATSSDGGPADGGSGALDAGSSDSGLADTGDDADD